MAIVKWAKGIDSVSGLLSSRPKSGQPHSSHTNALLATHRVAPTTNPNCSRLYMVGEYNRTGLPSSNELNARERFGEVAAAVRLRKKSLSTLAADREAFNAQKDLAGGKKTFTAYLWKVCGDAYDTEHNG